VANGLGSGGGLFSPPSADFRVALGLRAAELLPPTHAWQMTSPPPPTTMGRKTFNGSSFQSRIESMGQLSAIKQSPGSKVGACDDSIHA